MDYNFNNNFRFNTTYNSGFSPEETYLRRDFINAMLVVTVAKIICLKISNYFENQVPQKKRSYSLEPYIFLWCSVKRILALRWWSMANQVTQKHRRKRNKIIAAGKALLPMKRCF
jgi:hypothetical protein